MHHKNDACLNISLIFLAVVIATSCNNNAVDIPFPVKGNGYLQPVSKPLQFGPVRQLHLVWQPIPPTKPAIEKLDINTLPATKYDTAGFEPCARPQPGVKFDFLHLPSAPFSIDRLAPHPLGFKTTLLPIPVTIKAPRLTPKTGTTTNIYDMGILLGLQGKQVFSLLKDKNGFMWIGTNDGLYRYDGEYLSLYKAILKDIVELAEDSYGRIWFMQERGIGVLDVHKATLQYSELIRVPKNGYSTMMTDNQGHIWASHTAGSGVFVIYPENATYKQIDKTSGLTNNNAQQVLEDSEKNIWVNTLGGGANIINNAEGRIKYLSKAQGLASDSLQAITSNGNQHVWLSVNNKELDAVDLRAGTITHYNTFHLPVGADIYKLAMIKGEIWIATSVGLVVLSPTNNSVKYLSKGDDVNNNLVFCLAADDKQRVWVSAPYSNGLTAVEQGAALVHPAGISTVSAILQDSTGNIWVGTGSEGVVILDVTTKLAHHLKKANGLTDDNIQTLTEIDGKIWVTSFGGVDVINVAAKTIEHKKVFGMLANDTIMAVMKDRSHNIWLGGMGKGIGITSLEKQHATSIWLQNGLTDSHIEDIKQDKSGMVWVATAEAGVNIVDLQKGTITSITNSQGLSDTCDKVLFADAQGRVWIATDRGIFVADLQRQTITNITTAEGLVDNTVLSLHPFNGSVIAGTHKGASIITPPGAIDISNTKNIPGQDWKIALLANSEGLVNDGKSFNSNAITKAGQYLWGEDGITIINDVKPEEGSTATFITALYIMNTPKYFLTKPVTGNKDTIWGADTFYVRGKMPVIAGADAKDGMEWDSVAGPYNIPVNLQLPHDKNYIQFQFGQANLGRQDTVWYSYILLGVDKQWSKITNSNFSENYLNLSPGNYAFKVCSKNISGTWGKPSVFNFTILAPWWKTFTAYLVYLLFVTGAIWVIVYWRGKRLMQANKMLEQKIALRTAEVLEQKSELMSQRDQLENTLSELQAAQKQLIQSEKMASLGELTAGIAHEIQNPLNFVNNFADVSKELMDELMDEVEKDNKEEVKALAADIAFNLTKINHHGKRADAIVKGMLEHSRKSAGNKEPVDINALADEYAKVAYHGFRSKHITFNATIQTNFDNSIGKIHIIQQDIGRVLLNLFNNAFFAVAETKIAKDLSGIPYQPLVTLTTKKVGSVVLLTIADNGGGIPAKIIEKIFQPFFTTKPTGQGTGLGLSLSYDIIKAHGGEITVNSNEGAGATFTLKLPVG